MIAFLSAGDATFGGAIVTGIAAVAVAAIAARNAHAVRKELRPNGGSSAYDAIQRRFDAQDVKLDRLIAEHAAEQVRRQFDEAVIRARLERLEEKP